jgi:hypothetical protein
MPYWWLLPSYCRTNQLLPSRNLRTVYNYKKKKVTIPSDKSKETLAGIAGEGFFMLYFK